MARPGCDWPSSLTSLIAWSRSAGVTLTWAWVTAPLISLCTACASDSRLPMPSSTRMQSPMSTTAAKRKGRRRVLIDDAGLELTRLDVPDGATGGQRRHYHGGRQHKDEEQQHGHGTSDEHHDRGEDSAGHWEGSGV